MIEAPDSLTRATSGTMGTGDTTMIGTRRIPRDSFEERLFHDFLRRQVEWWPREEMYAVVVGPSQDGIWRLELTCPQPLWDALGLPEQEIDIDTDPDPTAPAPLPMSVEGTIWVAETERAQPQAVWQVGRQVGNGFVPYIKWGRPDPAQEP
jgi:hypothetical protein